MSLKCSVFGHKFGDPEVEREREEQGSEVVITITETETCGRCGKTRVVSENKEVTTLETPSDIVAEDLGDDDGAETTAEGETPAPDTPADAGDDDAELITETEASEQFETEPEPAPSGGVADPATGTDPEDDDAVILDEEDGEERAPGEWPQEEDGDGDEEGDERAETGEREPGAWPQEDDDAGDDWSPSTDSQDLRPIEEEQPDVEPTGTAVTVPEGEFHCPECGFTTQVEASSLRAGDFCPECHRGALAHQPEE
jgi:ssDNA-binding Zn-finger/Zn-ribbon topoisomerase 1